MQDKTTIKFLPWFGIPKLWPYFRAYRKDMIIMFVTGAIATLGEIIFPLFNQFAINISAWQNIFSLSFLIFFFAII